MQKVTMCCTTCPSGCALTVTIGDDNQVALVEGNNCPRGEIFAHGEWTDPVRTLTSTAYMTLNGTECLLPVKTSQPISKMKMTQAMEEINALVIDHPVTMGDVLLKDIAGTGIDLVACMTLK